MSFSMFRNAVLTGQFCVFSQLSFYLLTDSLFGGFLLFLYSGCLCSAAVSQLFYISLI